jgi:lysozyme family protein
LKWECVIGSDGQIRFENDPDDPGGLTFAGIDKASNREFPFDNPTAEAVRDTYYHSYWNFAFANTLNFPVGEVVANFAVNVGIGEAKLFLQRGVNAVHGSSVLVVDGDLGPKSFAAASLLDPFKLSDNVVRQADAYYQKITPAPHQSRPRHPVPCRSHCKHQQLP